MDMNSAFWNLLPPAVPKKQKMWELTGNTVKAFCLRHLLAGNTRLLDLSGLRALIFWPKKISWLLRKSPPIGNRFAGSQDRRTFSWAEDFSISTPQNPPNAARLRSLRAAPMWGPATPWATSGSGSFGATAAWLAGFAWKKECVLKKNKYDSSASS